MNVLHGYDGENLRAGIDESQVSILLNDLPRRMPGVVHAIALAADGMKVAWTDLLDATHADKLSAAVSSLSTLATTVSFELGTGAPSYTMIVMEGGTLLIMPVGNRLCLAALARPDADIGGVAGELAATVERVGELITPAQRQPAAVSR
ncbi:roadblock/LC7 domain-containing protein [Dactylosporangium sp. CA-233914]|uniref:roadblock/LC7 domain-containing protein n=1 Tax=Dactylosporangium sp. CA-233914 TaxID=3239934 RepID=UPI003D8B18D4